MPATDGLVTAVRETYVDGVDLCVLAECGTTDQHTAAGDQPPASRLHAGVT